MQPKPGQSKDREGKAGKAETEAALVKKAAGEVPQRYQDPETPHKHSERHQVDPAGQLTPPSAGNPQGEAKASGNNSNEARSDSEPGMEMDPGPKWDL